MAIFAAVQERYGYLPERALRLISDRMTIHWAQVFGAAGLGGFRLLPAEGHVITVCTCAACRFAGGDDLLAALRDELGIGPGEVTADGRFTLETSPEVGAGAMAPALRIDTLVFGPLNAAQARHLIEERQRTRGGDRMTVEPPRGTGLSPQIRILPRGEQRLLANVGRVDPNSLASYREHGGYAGLERAVAHLGPEGVIAEIADAGLRGRGGGGWPTADKWRAARAAAGSRKVVVVNLMGADPTALGDRALAEGNPHLVLEGALLAAFATGASELILAVRRDWTQAIGRLRAAIEEAEASRLAGYLILGTDFSCQASVWEGSGALVAGEETALLAALSGDRGMPVIRPPYPTEKGLADAPTTVQNAETLAHAAWILAHSAAAFTSVGSQASPGTKLVSIYGRVSEPGLLEVPAGNATGQDHRPGGRIGGHGQGGLRGRRRRWRPVGRRAAHALRRGAAPRGGRGHRPWAGAGHRHRHLHGRHGALLPGLVGARGLWQGRPVPDRHQAAGRDAGSHPRRHAAARTTWTCCAPCRAR